jgi:hypothetical protein
MRIGLTTCRQRGKQDKNGLYITSADNFIKQLSMLRLLFTNFMESCCPGLE